MSQARKTLGSLQQRFSVVRVLYTLAVFVLAAAALPCFLLLGLGITVSRRFWLRLLERFYPELEFVSSTSVRATVETSRNQGIVTVVLRVKGHCDVHQFRSRLQSDILDRRKNGRLVFPHLRTRLTSLWGWYAWCRGSETHFNINNHVAVTEAVYNSGLRDDLNCQKFISDMVSKYICPDHPPWHLLVIPSADKFYVLIRLHHLYLSEERLGLGDLLLLEPDSPIWSEEVEEYLDHEHLLAGTFKTPVALPQVYQHVCESLSNSWNELVSVYDPLENPKTTVNPTVKSYAVLAAIVTVSVVKTYLRNENGNLAEIVRREMSRRGLTSRLLYRSVVHSLHPVVVARAALMWLWWCVVSPSLQLVRFILNLPLYLYWTVLGYHVLRELVYLARVVVSAPRVVLQELGTPHGDSHHLQTVSLCGRKAVSWSEAVPLEYIHRIHLATGASSCEVLLAAVAASLRDYFRYAGFKAPQSVMTTARFIPQEKLLSQSAGSHHEGGLLCLDLPLWPPDQPFYNLGVVQEALYRARAKQAPLYLASMFGLDHSVIPKIFPSILARIILNLLSRRYAVTITQVDATSSEKKRRRMLWGQEVEGVMYWRPPQANISLSLTLMSYGDSVRLGVMSDMQIAPQHSVISYNFDKHIAQLAALAGVSRRPSHGRADNSETSQSSADDTETHHSMADSDITGEMAGT